MSKNVVDDHWRNTGNEVDASAMSAWGLKPLPLLNIRKSWGVDALNEVV